MISRALLDALLILVAGAWAAVSVAIIVNRYGYEWRSRRLRQWKTTLGVAPLAALEAGKDITAAEFAEMAVAGLPADTEADIAEQLCVRGGDQLSAIATGTLAKDVRTRIVALQILVSARHENAHEALERGLRSGNRHLAAAALRLLIRQDDRDAAAILASALADCVYSPSRIAAALDRMSVARSDLLGALVQHADPTVRFWGVRLAGRLLAREWALQVRALTADPDPLVRRAVVETLGRFGDPKDLVLLLTRFLDPAPMVRVHAARATAAFGSRPVADALCELLADRQWIVRAAARETLRSIGRAGTPALVRALWEEDRFAANNAAEVLFETGAIAAAARHALRNNHDPDMLPLVRRFIAVAGLHFTRGLFDQLGASDAARLAVLTRATHVETARQP